MKAKGGRGQQASRGHHHMMAKSIKRIVLGTGQLENLSDALTEVFS
jgi:hypothetical protein